MAETRRKVQLHKKGDQSDMWIPYTTGGCVQLTEYENDGVTSGAIVGGDDGDTLNTALMRLENRLPFVGATGESDGAQGEVPAPTLADKEKFLKGDGTWSVVESSEIGDGEVTITVNGTPYTFTMNQSTNLQIDISIPQNPVIFKGSVNTTGINGTTTPFPAADATNNGHEYKVTEDGTYQGVSAKVDDMLISNGVMWIKIPSGDEPSGTVTSIGATNGVKTDKTGGAAISDSGTLSLNLKTTTRSAYDSETPVDVSGRQYPVVLDKTNGYLSVNVPWVEYTNASAVSGGTALSLVTTGDKYAWNSKPDIGSGATNAAAGNHTHSVGIAADSGSTVGINLAFGSQYKLTAGGESFVFTTPQSPSSYGSGTGINIDSNNNINVKLGYTTSGNNRAVKADSNGSLYVTQTDTTYSDFTPASSSAGSAGLVPAPTTNDKAKFLNGGSGWVALAVDETKTVSSSTASFAVTYGHNYFVGGADVTAISSGSNNAVNTLTITGVNDTDNPTGADFETNIFFKAGSSFTKPTFSNNTPMLIGELPTFEANGIYLMSLYKGTVIFGTLSSYTNA